MVLDNVQAQSQPSLTRQLIRLAGPMVMSNLAYTLLGAADTFFMGRVSTQALGAVGIGSIAFLASSLVFRGTIGGAIPFVARRYGAGNREQAGQVLHHFLFLAMILTPFVLVMPWVFRSYFSLTRPDPEAAQLALVYISIRIFELPLSLVSTAMFSFLMGIGNSRLPMVLSWITVTVNISANYVLVFGKLGFPSLGIAGAAWGTVVAVAVQALLSSYIVFRRYGLAYHLSRWTVPSLSELKAMVKVGLPIGLSDFVEVAAFTTFLTLVSRLGPAELAASQIANQISALAFMPGFALAAATGSLVGRYLGAGKPEISEAVGYRGAALGIGLMGMVGILFLLVPGPLVGIFTKDPLVLPLARTLLRLMALYQVFDALNIIFRGALNGAGDTRFAGMVTLVGAWGLFVPSTYFWAFVMDFGLIGAWMGAIGYLITLAIVFTWRFRSGRWKTIQL